VHVAKRGGQYTYHGPGQRVVYVMLDLGRRGRDVRRFVCALEGWVIAALAEFNVTGRAGRAGSASGWSGPTSRPCPTARCATTRSPRSG
jgi:lipoate-protein ligase B